MSDATMLSLDSETVVVALVGLPAAGKSTIAGTLERAYGFHWIRTREIVQELGADATIGSLQQHGVSLSSGEGLHRFCEGLFSRIVTGRCNIVDAVRPVSHWEAIKSKFGDRATLVGVHAPRELRASRFTGRNSLLALEERDNHAVERDIPALLDIAGYVVMNDDCLDYRVELMLAFLFRDTLPPPIAVIQSAMVMGVELSHLATLKSLGSPEQSGSRISATIERLRCP